MGSKENKLVKGNKEDFYLTILMPCLNEEDSIKQCIVDANTFLRSNNIRGEVLIIDNGSTDSSIRIAVEEGARVIEYQKKGYGAALRCGIDNAWGTHIIMGDCDGSYDFLNLEPFITAFRHSDIVIGNRYTKMSEAGSLSLSHRFGGEVLSFLARLKCKSKVRDFHCGLRGGNVAVLRTIGLKTDGFEFATEMLMKSARYKTTQFPIRYRVVTRSCSKSKLRPIKDGLRHLKYIWRFKESES